MNSILPVLYDLVDQAAPLTDDATVKVTHWAWAFLAEFERARHQLDEATQLLAEFERLPPAQRTALLAFAKRVAEGKMDIPR